MAQLFFASDNALAKASREYTLVGAEKITLTAIHAGSAGNSISFAITDAGDSNPIAITVTDKAISVAVDIDFHTPDDVKAALLEDASVTNLVDVTGDAGSTPIAATITTTSLTGGADEKRVAFSFEDIKSIESTTEEKMTIRLDNGGSVVLNIFRGYMPAVAKDLCEKSRSSLFTVIANDNTGEYLSGVTSVASITYAS
jgi:acyl-CoA synthetase (NDP forming)